MKLATLHNRAPNGLVIFGDNLAYLKSILSDSIDLIYIDPPFNTGKLQRRTRLRTTRDDASPDRIGFKGLGYRTSVIDTHMFNDKFANFEEFILPRLQEAYRVLKPNGSLFLHIDYREVHYCKLYLDDIFGRTSFINEIIWAYDFGARSKTRWSPKHDNILWYAKDPDRYTFNYDDVDRIPYLAPTLVGAEKAARGKTPSDTWWHTIVSPTGKEKTGYPTQKPLGIIERIVRLHSNPDDTVLDFFAGSGTVGEACAKLGRHYILVDNNPEALEVMKTRLGRFGPEFAEVPAVVKTTRRSSAAAQDNRVQVIGAAVWNYDEKGLRGLRGPEKDAAMVREMFLNDSPMGLYDNHAVTILENPTAEELRTELINYVQGRSAKGDILVFYYSGHGMVLGNNEFGFCLKDTRIREDTGAFLPLSVVTFRDVLSTLRSADIHPVFIIDACFSAKATLTDLIHAIQDDMHRTAANSYALFCACYEDGVATDTVGGGAFTKAIYEVVSAGLSDAKHKQLPVLELSDLTKSVQTKLEKDGMPLSKLYTAADLPDFPLVKNVAFQARTESFMPYHRGTLGLMWNGGEPKTVTLSEISASVGHGAYGNHSKLSLAPWALVEDGKNRHERRLTELGKDFMRGKLSIPSVIVRDPDSGEWHAAKEANGVLYSAPLA